MGLPAWDEPEELPGPAGVTVGPWRQRLSNFGTAYLGAGGIYAAYLMLLPSHVRAAAATRHAGFWKSVGLMSVLAIGVYESWQASRLDAEYERLRSSYSRSIRQANQEAASRSSA